MAIWTTRPRRTTHQVRYVRCPFLAVWSEGPITGAFGCTLEPMMRPVDVSPPPVFIAEHLMEVWRTETHPAARWSWYDASCSVYVLLWPYSLLAVWRDPTLLLCCTLLATCRGPHMVWVSPLDQTYLKTSFYYVHAELCIMQCIIHRASEDMDKHITRHSIVY